jgi:uncharacterized protein
MQYREYGNTGKQMSALGFGAMRFGEPENLEKSVRTVLRAFELGVTYFDTAPDYCRDKSEINVGHAVLEMKKSGKPFYLSTKSNKADGDALRRDLERSLKRLNVDTIDFFNCWCLLNLDSWERRKKGGAVDAIMQAKEEGLIRHAVFSTHMCGADIRTVIEEGYFEGVTLGYNAVNFPYREEGIRAAAEHNMGVVIMNPLGGGTLIEDNEQNFGFIKVRPEQTMLEAALHFLLANDKVTVALVGFRNERDVEAAVAAVESYQPYTPEQIQHIREQVQGEYNTLCTSCMYCDVCPEGIPVWKFMETYNHLMLEGGEYVGDRLKFHWGTNIRELDRCTQCGQCEEVCTQQLPILERFEELKHAIRK